jgi:hypothetical protein
VAALECWKEMTLEASRDIKSLSFSHIYREDNKDANTLSKKVLSMPLGHLRYSQWEDGNEGPPFLLNLSRRSGYKKSVF